MIVIADSDYELSTGADGCSGTTAAMIFPLACERDPGPISLKAPIL